MIKKLKSTTRHIQNNINGKDVKIINNNIKILSIDNYNRKYEF